MAAAGWVLLAVVLLALSLSWWIVVPFYLGS